MLPEWGLETFAQTSPNRQQCLVSDVPSDAVARLWVLPRVRRRMRGMWVFPRARGWLRGRRACPVLSSSIYWNAVVPPVSGLQSSGNTWGFSWHIHTTNAYFSGGIGCGVVKQASSTMRSGYCHTDVSDISSGHGGPDAGSFFSTQGIS